MDYPLTVVTPQTLKQMRDDWKSVFEHAHSVLRHVRLVFGYINHAISPLGSALLLRAGSKFFLITAAHVLNENNVGQVNLVTHGEKRLLALKGYSLRTHVASGKPDQTDVGWLELSDAIVQQIGSEQFLTPEDIDVDDAGLPNSLYFAVGYPASRNKQKEKIPDAIEPKALVYAATLASDHVYRKRQLMKETHLLVNFSKKKSSNSSNQRVQPPDPYGMSGGGVWCYKTYGGSTSPPRLVGLLIEWYSSNNVLVAVRMSLVFEALRKEYPELAPLFPRTNLVNITVNLIRDPHDPTIST